MYKTLYRVKIANLINGYNLLGQIVGKNWSVDIVITRWTIVCPCLFRHEILFCSPTTKSGQTNDTMLTLTKQTFNKPQYL